MEIERDRDREREREKDTHNTRLIWEIMENSYSTMKTVPEKF